MALPDKPPHSPAALRLYHGSDVAIEHPDIAFNTGFADLGQGFYLTDNYAGARSRAYLRSRRMGSPAGIVSVFEFDETFVPWATWGREAPTLPDKARGPHFGLRFEKSRDGIIAWANYIVACRQGLTELAGLGDPVIVRGWIATEEIEMLYAGFATAEEIAELLDPAKLLVQYCLRDQQLIDQALTFVRAEVLTI